jgi:hypothetical protein
MAIKLNSRRWLWIGVVLFSLGLAGAAYFGVMVLQTKIEGIFYSLDVTDTEIKSFKKVDCPWALNPGEKGTVTVVFPYPGLYNSTRVTGTRLDVSPGIPPVGDSQEFKWEITALGGGNGVLIFDAPSTLDRSQPGSQLYWGSMYNQACSILVSVLGLPYQAYLLLCLLLTTAGFGSLARWAAGLEKTSHNSTSRRSFP